MTLQSALRAWDDFFFAETSPLPIAVFRILYGGVVIATLLLLRPDWLAWYGVHSWVTLPTMLKVEPGARLNLFAVMPQSNAWINGLFWFFLTSAVLLMVGFCTRLNSVVVFVCLASVQQRNLYMLHGGDTFLRLSSFFLMFAPAGAALSVDRLIRRWRGREPAELTPRSPWAQRMIQLQLALLYLVTCLLKLKGLPWRQGTALFYVYHLDELRRFPEPAWLFLPIVLKLGSWAALALEFSLGALIWIRKLRYPLLGVGVLFHLWLEYSLNIPMFQWDILSAYVLFVEPEHLSSAGKRILRRERWLASSDGTAEEITESVT